jgi:hypothetical protein
MLPAVRTLFCLTVAMCASAANAETPAVAPALPAPVSYMAPEQAVKLPPPPERYAAPSGFGGHRWGEARTAFTGLPDKPQGIGAAWSQGKVTSIDIDCRSAGPQRCSVNDFLLAAWKQRVDGGGFFALSEYFVETQGFKLPRTGVVMWPVVYQFCANWQSHFKEVPKDFEKLNKFCGMRLLFQTETLAQLSGLPEDHVTRYDLVLSELISRYGKPANFTWRGHVTIEPVNGPVGPASRGQRKFDTWRWCPAPRDGLMTRCPASIVLTLDPEQGRGIVLFSTPELWKYAAAREDGPAQPDALYTLLHALSLKNRTAYAQREEQRHKAEQEAAAANAGARPTIPAALESGGNNSGSAKP